MRSMVEGGLRKRSARGTPPPPRRYASRSPSRSGEEPRKAATLDELDPSS
jgi:hypothetical protein